MTSIHPQSTSVPSCLPGGLSLALPSAPGPWHAAPALTAVVAKHEEGFVPGFFQSLQEGDFLFSSPSTDFTGKC